MENKNKIFAILNTLGFIGTVVVNALANALPLNGKNTGQLSDQYPNLFVPAGFTFSIWGVIYLLLAVFIVYQLLLAFKKFDKGKNAIEAIGPYFFISSLANMGWIFAWHYELVGLSLLFMLVILFSLIAIYVRLDIRKRNMETQQKICIAIPFSVYLGWITVATIANITALLVNIGWGGFGIQENVWTILVIIVAALITLTVIFSRQDIFYALVVAWALFGILMKRIDVGGGGDTGIIITVSVCLGIILLDILFQLARKRAY